MDSTISFPWILTIVIADAERQRLPVTSVDPQLAQDLWEALGFDAAQIAEAVRRQLAVLHGEEGYCPIICSAGLTPAQEALLPPPVSLDEEFSSHVRTLTNGLRAVAALLNSGSDGAPCIRPNMGVGVCATVFGCVQTVFPDKMPWVTKHVTWEALDDFDAETAPLGAQMELAMERAHFLRAHLEGSGVTPYCFDTQGPFDLAHLVVGDALFYALYDAPERVHRLLDQCVRLIVRVTNLYKEAATEPRDGGRHSGVLAMRGGIRVCEDTSTLLNAAQIAEFVTPYTNRLLAAFGGGWVHYCGRNDALYRAVIDEMPLAYALNFGNPEKHDLAAVLDDLLQRGKTYFGGVPRRPDEDTEAHFRRVLSYTQGCGRGLIFHHTGGADAARDVALWRELQAAG